MTVTDEMIEIAAGSFKHWTSPERDTAGMLVVYRGGKPVGKFLHSEEACSFESRANCREALEAVFSAAEKE